MDIWEKMKQCEEEMTPKEHEVYELIQKHTFLFFSSTASDLANRFNISQSAISRFCKRIGYEGYSDFRLAFYAATHSSPIIDKSQAASHDQAYYFSQLVLETKKCSRRSSWKSSACGCGMPRLFLSPVMATAILPPTSCRCI